MLLEHGADADATTRSGETALGESVSLSVSPSVCVLRHCYSSVSCFWSLWTCKPWLWPPCVADADIIFLPCGFYLSFFYSSPNLSGHRLDVYHTSTHGVALVRI